MNEPVGVLRLVDPFRAGDAWVPLAPAGYRVTVEQVPWPPRAADVARIASSAVREQVRVVHAHGHRAHLIGVAAARLIRARSVCTGEPASLPEALALRAADAVVCGTGEERDRCVRRWNVPATRVHVVHPGIDLSRVLPRAPSPRPLIAAVGSLFARNGHVDFLEALARVRRTVPEVQAVCAGEGPMRPLLEARIAHLGLRGTVQLAGHLDDVFALLSQARAAWTPGPRATIEAVAAGVPAATPWSELIWAEVGAPRNDPAALAARLLACLHMLANAVDPLRKRALGEYSLDAFAARLQRVYDGVLAAQRAAA